MNSYNLYTNNERNMDILLGFKNTFNELLCEKDISAKEAGRLLNTLPSVVSKWKNKAEDLKLKSVIKIADFFDCSLEFLCGHTAEQLNYTPQLCPPFGERIVTVLHECNCSSYKLFKSKIVSPAQYQHWRTGTEPLLSSVAKIANYLNVTIDYLVGRDR